VGWVVLAACSVTLFTFLSSQFSLDDAAIYQRLVTNIAYYGIYSYNLYEPVNAGTSVLYPFILSLAVWIVPHVSLPQLAVMVDAAFLFCGTLALMSFIWKVSGSIVATVFSALACLLLQINDLLGMEASLLVCMMALYLYWFDRTALRRGVVALFPLVRPEGVVFLGVELAYTLWCKRAALRSLVGEARSLVLMCVPLCASCALSWWLFGEAIPHSASNKLDQGGGGWYPYRSFLIDLAAQSYRSLYGLAVSGLAVMGTVYVFRRRVVSLLCFGAGVALWQFGLIVLKAPHYTWYSLSLYFAIFVGVCLGLASLERELHRVVPPAASRLLSYGCSVILLVCVCLFLVPHERRGPESRQEAQHRVAAYIAAVHQGAHARVAALEVGHLGNALDASRFSIYDLCGLTSKNKGFFQRGFNDDFFCRAQPEYLVLNLFHIRPLAVTQSVTETPDLSLIRYSTGEYHKIAWQHHVGLALDPRLRDAYEFLKFIESPGYPGGFAVFRRIDSFSCSTDRQIQVSTVVASREHDANTSAYRAVDGDLASSWNAGAGHVQWLRFELEKPELIRSIQLFAVQDREYSSKLRIRFLSSAGVLLKAFEVPVTVVDGDLLDIKLRSPQEAAFVEVESVRGHNWAAWREVAFFH
jgi:hypothetical protein